MNPTTLQKAKLLFNLVKKGVKNIRTRSLRSQNLDSSLRSEFKNAEVVVCPPFIYLSTIQQLDNQIIKLGAQDCFWDPPAGGGAYTGEISPLMLKNLGCQYVILGHLERRKYFKETDEMINKKIKAVLKIKLKPILCVGETQKDRKTNRTQIVIKSQIRKALQKIPKKEIKNLILAYEPVWAIGTGRACGVSEAKSVNSFIKKIVKNTPILYGGSVNSKNAREYLKEADFQGLLVGGASLNAEEFIKIVKVASRA